MLARAVVVVGSPDEGGTATADAASAIVERPPQLMPLANRPLLLHALDSISAAGLKHVAVAAGRRTGPAVREVIAEGGFDEKGLEVEVLDAPGGEGLRGALSEVGDFVGDEPFLLHLGDSLHKGGLEPLLAGGELGSADARVLTCPAPDRLRSRIAEGSARPRVEQLRRPGAAGSGATHAGVYVLGSEAIKVAADGEAPARLAPAGLISALCDRGGHVETCPALRSWRLGDRLDGWLEGNRLALENIEPSQSMPALFDTDIQGNVLIHPTAEIRSSVVRGPAVIGPMTRLTDAYVGPYSSIGAGVLIEAAEIENSIILTGASIRYLGGRLEASIIGQRARVFRDFRLPKALRLSVGENAEVALA